MKASLSGSAPRAKSHPLKSWLLGATLLGAAIAPGCGSDAPSTEAPVTLGVSITSIDGKGSDEPVLLHCDGTIAVQVTLSADPDERRFVLRPARACGTSGRCGYVRLEALDSADQALAVVDTATTAGVLQLSSDDLARVTQIRAGLRRGIDDEPVINPDQAEVTTIATPTFVPPSTCPVSRGAGGDGAGGAPSQGGAAGQTMALGGSAGESAGGTAGAAGAFGAAGEPAGGAPNALGGAPSTLGGGGSG